MVAPSFVARGAPAERLWRWLASNRAAWIAAVLSLFAVAGGILFYTCVHLRLADAYIGFSPRWVVLSLKHPDWFPGDFASGGGGDELLKSPIMWLYPAADWIALNIYYFSYLMLGLEVLAFAAAGVIATRLLKPELPSEIGYLVALFLIAGRLLNSDLAMFGHPVYGWVYNWSYAPGLVGASLAIRNKTPVLSGLLLGSSVAIHPVLGLLIGIFAGVAVLVELRRYAFSRLMLMACAAALAAGPWLIYIVHTSAIEANGIPDHLYLFLARTLGNHWFPAHLGVYSDRHWTSLVPFLSFCLLLCIYLFDDKGHLSRLHRQMALGAGALLVLVVAGLLIADVFPTPLLVKLCLQRADRIMMLFGAFVVVPGLWRDVTEGPRSRAILAALALLSPFFVRNGIPVALAAILAAGSILQAVHHRRFGLRESLIVSVAALLVVAFVYVGVNGNLERWTLDAYTGIDPLIDSSRPVPALLTMLVSAFAALRKPALVIGAIAIAAVSWTAVLDPVSPSEVEKARSYAEVEDWARTHTPIGTLFMPPPMLNYGWRERSERPSYGTLREWLYTGWIYDSRRSVFDEGVRRFEALGLHLNDYYEMDVKARNSADGRLYDDVTKSYFTPGGRLYEDVVKRYYSGSHDVFERIHSLRGVKFFVFDRSKMKVPAPLPVVYENADYLVAQYR